MITIIPSLCKIQFETINHFVAHVHQLLSIDELNGGRDEGECWTERNNYSSKETRSQSRPRQYQTLPNGEVETAIFEEITKPLNVILPIADLNEPGHQESSIFTDTMQ